MTGKTTAPTVSWRIGSGRATTCPIPVGPGSVQGVVTQLLGTWAWEARVSTGGWCARQTWQRGGMESRLVEALMECQEAVEELWDEHRPGREVEEPSDGDAEP